MFDGAAFLKDTDPILQIILAGFKVCNIYISSLPPNQVSHAAFLNCCLFIEKSVVVVLTSDH